ncbi:hypothetical protein M569_03941 [Genlisea aurea]|uniref:Uncharacterized protein n=1 Tax=Genlisea aurea TaxID=192259 RepID=S8CVH8_9LAMI|nr:hypothetical protein M569_03941 [Genlisea aurea]
MSDFFSLDCNSGGGGSGSYFFKNEEIYNKGFELWQQYYHLHQQRLLQLQLHHDAGSNFDGYDCSPSKRGGQGMNCQDCGNQAKKDCLHLRCRTCCKSRGFQCQTHVKSTWVPAARRRERQQQQQQQQLAVADVEEEEEMRESSTAKRLREAGDASRLPVSGFEVENFPAEVNCPAIFRCVRVSSVDDGDDQLAYHTAVAIGGHLFKGILYDQGPENRPAIDRRRIEGASAGGVIPAVHQQAHDVISAADIDPSIYPTPLNAFISGNQYFPPPRPSC